MMRRSWALVLLAALTGVAILIACSGGSPSRSMGNPLTTVTISDPTTCGAPRGPFQNIFVTVVDVQINTSPTAGDSDSGWQSVIPDNKGKPQQVDLLGAADTQCFLKRLGSTTQLQPGSYQQIRVILADNTNQPSPNACGQAGSNCVILTADETKTPKPLLLSSEAQTGIKIPGSQIAGGQFVVEAGQQKDLNIDFNACASIVTQGNGGFRLKPVLHAGEVTAVATISGRVVDKATNQAITGGTVLVVLEANEGGTETVKMQTTADSNGNFNFCPVSPLASGSYDVVAIAINGNTAYAMTVTTGVNPGAMMGNIPLTAVGAPATIDGVVTAQNASQVGATSDISVAALQTATTSTGDIKFVVPLPMQSAVMVPLSTESKTSCPANTFCQSYEMVLPAATPAVGVFSSTSPSWSTPATTGASYFINAQATIPESGGAANCTTPNQTTAAVPVTAGTLANAPQLDFVGCH